MRTRPPDGREWCVEIGCEQSAPRGDAFRCGGSQFGTIDDPGLGCGRYFCEEDLSGNVGPLYCRSCKREAQRLANRRRKDVVDPLPVDKFEQERRRARIEMTSSSIFATLVAYNATDDWALEDKAKTAVKAAMVLVGEVDAALAAESGGPDQAPS